MTMKININKIQNINEWLGPIEKPLIIAGPCSIESEEQTISIALELEKNPHVKIFRGGIWKPRTRPNSFEGVGEIGLKWLQNVKKITNLKIATEVATPEHVEKALKHDVDILWIGARSTTNPFTVQAIADAIKGTNITVMIKNPVNPDLDLWVGAIERIYNAGITKIVAVHRGFSSFQKTKYRNAPEWKNVIELKRQIPSLPIITDPSHICGNRESLLEISQKAIDLNIDGLMIEVHNKPEYAMSDAHQQITPDELNKLLNNLIPRNESSENKDFENKLDTLRTYIDRIDDELINIVAERMRIVEEIGRYKKENKVTILQIKRWDEIMKNRLILANSKNLKEDFINILFQLLHEESIIIQTEIMNNK